LTDFYGIFLYSSETNILVLNLPYVNETSIKVVPLPLNCFRRREDRIIFEKTILVLLVRNARKPERSFWIC